MDSGKLTVKELEKANLIHFNFKTTKSPFATQFFLYIFFDREFLEIATEKRACFYLLPSSDPT